MKAKPIIMRTYPARNGLGKIHLMECNFCQCHFRAVKSKISQGRGKFCSIYCSAKYKLHALQLEEARQITKEYTEYHKKDLILVDNCSACKKEYFPSDNPHNRDYDHLACPKCNKKK